MTTPSPYPGPTLDPAQSGLAAALAAEQAAIFAYGPVGAWLPAAEAELARQAEIAHRDRRDALLIALAEQGQQPAVGGVYDLPFPVTGPDQARQLAILVEERVAAVWRAALPDLTDDQRAHALAALVDAAVQATRWRQAAGLHPATVEFPGAS